MVAVAPLSLSFPRLRIEVASRAWLDVRRFAVEEAVSKLFHVELEAHSEAPNLDLDTIVGKEAMFCLETDFAGPYSWAGLCSEMEQTAVSPEGYSTYRLVVVPTLWLATQRRNHRSFQRCSELDIAAALLDEWGIEAEYRVDPGAYKAREYRVQYGESDYAFFCRMLEDAGISFFFEDGGRLVLADAPHEASVYGELGFVDGNEAPPPREYVSGVRIGRRIRPGRYLVRDHDFRRPPQYLLAADSTGGDDVESRLERFHYEPGSFAYESQQGEASPVADDKLRVRSDIEEGDKLARRRLDAKRATARVVSFDTNAQYVGAGTVLTIGEHPHAALAGKPILVVARTMRGACNAVWSQRCEAVSTEFSYRPPVTTPKPKVNKEGKSSTSL